MAILIVKSEGPTRIRQVGSARAKAMLESYFQDWESWDLSHLSVSPDDFDGAAERGHRAEEKAADVAVEDWFRDHVGLSGCMPEVPTGQPYYLTLWEKCHTNWVFHKRNAARCEGVTEARVDACGPRRDEARKLEKRRSEESADPRGDDDAEDAEDEPNVPLLFPRGRARASS